MILEIQDVILKSINLQSKMLADVNLLRNIQNAVHECVRCLRNGGKILIAGNGGSAADAQHMAAEFVGRFSLERPGLAAIALTTDSSALTAIANDYGYANVFQRQLRALGRSGDVFIGISTSGNSHNVVDAMVHAELMGIKRIAMTGKDGLMVSTSMSDHLLRVSSEETARIQEAHGLLIHIICHLVEQELYGTRVTD